MNRKNSSAQCYAKAEAYSECANHLDLDWTDDPLEKQAGISLQRNLVRQANKWWALGDKRRRQEDDQLKCKELTKGD